MKRFLIILALIAALNPVAVYASDVSNAAFLTMLRVSNNSTSSQTNVWQTFDLSTSGMIASGLLNSTATDVAIRASGGSDVAFQPSVNASYPWVVQVPSINGQSQANLYLYSSNVSGGKLRYFPDISGITVADSDTIELADNGTAKVSGFVNTDNGTGKNLINKPDALSVYVSPTVSGNITARIPTVASDILKYSDDPEHITGGSTPTKQFEVTITSTVEVARVKFDIRDDGVHAIYGRVYKNGVVIGSTQTSAGAGYVTKSEDLTLSAVAGDKIQLYGWDNNTFPGYLRNFRVYYNDGASLTATGIETGEHEVEVTKSDKLLSLGIDKDYANFPASDNLVLNLPFWSENLKGTTKITSVDANAFSVNVSGPLWTSQGRDYDGVDDYIAIDDSDKFSFGNGSADGPVTFVIWVYFDTLPTAGNFESLFQKTWSPGSTLGEYDFYIDSTGQVFFLVGDLSASANIGKASSVNMTRAGEWYQLVGSYSGNSTSAGIHIYRDAGLIDYSNVATGTYVAMENTGKPLYIGSKATHVVNGKIGEVQIYDKCLTAKEIEHLYQATRWKYKTSPFLEEVSASTIVSDGFANGYGSVVATDNNTLLAVYCKQETKIKAMAKISTDNGATWGTAFQIRGDATYNYQPAYLRKLANGNLILVMCRNDGVIYNGLVLKSTNGGSIWSSGVTLTSTNLSAFSVGPPAEFPDGTLVIPLLELPYAAKESVHAIFSTNGGDTWGGEVIIANGDADNDSYGETTITPTGANSAIALIRKTTWPVDNHIDFYQTFTTDKGQTWSAITRDRLLGSSLAETLKLSNGNLISKVRRYDPGIDSSKYAMLYYSSDGGTTAWDFIGRFNTSDNRTNDGNIIELDSDTIGVLEFQNVAGVQGDVLFKVFNLVANNTNFFDYVAFSDNISNTSTIWTFFQNDVMPYIEYAEITKGGTQAGYWAWQYATTFDDQSINSNTAIPSFRTASSGTDMTATIVSQESEAEKDTPASPANTGWMMITSVPTQPPGLYTEGGTDFPGGPEVSKLATDTKVPYMWWMVWIAFASSLGLGALVYSKTHNSRLGRNGSLFIFWIVSTLVYVLWYIGGNGVVPGWPLIPYGIWCLALTFWCNPFKTAAG